MPILPLDHPEPFAATLGLMLYPATDESDPPKARAYAAQLLLADPIRRYLDAGHRLSQDTFERIAMDAGHPVTDLRLCPCRQQARRKRRLGPGTARPRAARSPRNGSRFRGDPDRF